jgi:hypothetical protein
MLHQGLFVLRIIRLASLKSALCLFMPEYSSSSILAGFDFTSISKVRFFSLPLNRDLPGGSG